MAGFISKQPNGLYCRFSTVTDCPTCGELLCDDGYKDTDIKYCDQCGQALDWEN